MTHQKTAVKQVMLEMTHVLLMTKNASLDLMIVLEIMKMGLKLMIILILSNAELKVMTVHETAAAFVRNLLLDWCGQELL